MQNKVFLHEEAVSGSWVLEKGVTVEKLGEKQDPRKRKH